LLVLAPIIGLSFSLCTLFLYIFYCNAGFGLLISFPLEPSKWNEAWCAITYDESMVAESWGVYASNAHVYNILSMLTVRDSPFSKVIRFVYYNQVSTSTKETKRGGLLSARHGPTCREARENYLASTAEEGQASCARAILSQDLGSSLPHRFNSYPLIRSRASSSAAIE
jgi:hypothetical protein